MLIEDKPDDLDLESPTPHKAGQGNACGAGSCIRKPLEYAPEAAALSEVGSYWFGLNSVPQS